MHKYIFVLCLAKPICLPVQATILHSCNVKTQKKSILFHLSNSPVKLVTNSFFLKCPKFVFIFTFSFLLAHSYLSVFTVFRTSKPTFFIFPFLVRMIFLKYEMIAIFKNPLVLITVIYKVLSHRAANRDFVHMYIDIFHRQIVKL